MELLPCPFCGGNAIVYQTCTLPEEWAAKCVGHCNTYYGGCATTGLEMTTIWNRRASQGRDEGRPPETMIHESSLPTSPTEAGGAGINMNVPTNRPMYLTSAASPAAVGIPQAPERPLIADVCKLPVERQAAALNTCLIDYVIYAAALLARLERAQACIRDAKSGWQSTRVVDITHAEWQEKHATAIAESGGGKG